MKTDISLNNLWAIYNFKNHIGIDYVMNLNNNF